MLNLVFDLPHLEAESLFNSLASREDSLKILSWSEEECGRRKKFDKSTDLRKISESGMGSFWSKTLSFGVDWHENHTHFFITSEKKNCIEALIPDIIHHNITFGYAAHFDELHHRNSLTKKITYGSNFSWVGRDYNRYLPGIYWRTFFSGHLKEGLKIDLSGLDEIVQSVVLLEHGLYYVQSFNEPDDWINHSVKIDKWLKNRNGVFSKSFVEPAYYSANNFKEIGDATRDWR